MSGQPTISRSTSLWLWRIASYLVIGFGLLFGILIVTLKLWVMPKIEEYRPDIISRLSQAIGQEVTIAELQADWQGWNPRFRFRDLQIKDAKGQTVLQLPQVSATVSWRSLFALDLRLLSLDIERPQLAVRRDAQGHFHIAGVALDPSQQGDGKMAEWLLQQRAVAVRDALILWQDDYQRAPQLLLDRVYFYMLNKGSRHRFGLVGVPPAELAAPIDIRGDFRLNRTKQWQKLSGHLYARLDYADISAWQEWLPPLPLSLKQAQGAMRLWVDIDNANPTAVVSDFELQRVRVRLGKEVAELALPYASGRLTWQSKGKTTSYATKNLSLQTNDGQKINPTDFRLALSYDDEQKVIGGEMSFNRLQLEPLRKIADRLPLQANLREQLTRYAPQGVLLEGLIAWQGELGKPERYNFRGKFQELGLTAQGAFPGLSRFTGSIEGDNRGGSLSVASKNIELNLPKVFATPLFFSELTGRVNWLIGAEDVQVKIAELQFVNDDLAGQTSGEYRTLPKGPGWIDLTATLSRTEVNKVYRYLPLVVHVDARQWVQLGLLAGKASETKLKLQGDLYEFPFANDKSGVFRVSTKVTEATLDYADAWPKIERINGTVQFIGPGMEIQAQSAETLGVKLRAVNTVIANLNHPYVQVKGEANDSLADFLRYVRESPLKETVGSMVSTMQGQGDAYLLLALDLPTEQMSLSKVRGELQFINNNVQVGEDVPRLRQLTGRLSFTEKELKADPLTAEILGGSARLQLTVRDKVLQVTANGRADLARLRNEYPYILLNSVSGQADWRLYLEAKERAMQWTLEAPLREANLALPAPFNKAPGESIELRIERNSLEGQLENTQVIYGKGAQLQVNRRANRNGELLVERGVLYFGAGQSPLDRLGFWLRGELKQIDLDSWLALKPADTAANNPQQFSLQGIDLRIDQLDVFTKRLNHLNFSAAKQGARWQVSLQGDELKGRAEWYAASAELPNGKLIARLQQFILPQDSPITRPATNDETARWPALDIVADSFWSKGHDLGKLELHAKPDNNGWRIENLRLANPDGVLQANGLWRSAGSQQRTSMDIEIKTSNAGGYLNRFALPSAVKGGKSKLNGQLNWAGSPQELDYPSLSGELRVEVERGQFTKVDPGFGKLLGVLSLQSLPRRVSLDFRDIFSEGFAFDEISGDVKVSNGVLSTNNLKIYGPAAKVDLTGNADVAQETQNLRVKVQPSISTGVAVGTALAVNPLVGGGVLLAQKVLKDPIEQMFAYEYQVTGKWSDPQVERVATK